MELFKICDLFNFEKGVLQSSKCTPGEFDFITASADWKTHDEYTHDCEALIFAAAASGSLGRTHYVNGKFISSDLCFIITPKDPINLPVDLKFYHLIFHEFKNDIVKNTKAGTSKEAIGLKSFGNYKLPYFDITKQIEVKKKFIEIQLSKVDLNEEFASQLSLVRQLRQAFLSEAMQGKIPQFEPPEKSGQAVEDQETGHQLLARIKAENAQLIKVKKLKEERELPIIQPEEIPFEIPENWIWCRLSDMCDSIIDCPHSTPKYIDTETDYFAIDTNCIDDRGNLKKLRGLTKQGFVDRTKRIVPKANDIIYAREGSIGRATFVPEKINVCLGQRVVLFRSSKVTCPKFLILAVTEKNYKNRLLSNHKGMGAKHINIKDIVLSLVALPPLSIQKQIVSKLNQLMKTCDDLENSIKQSEIQNEQLLQQVLKETLEVKEEAVN